MMPARATLLWRKLARVEKAFLLVLLLHLILSLAAPPSGFNIVLTIALWTLGVVVGVRLARRFTARVIWRLRNRLMVAYIFIAVVPILMILVLVVSAGNVIAGQLAVYLVNSELERRHGELAGVAGHPEMVDRLMPYLRSLLPGLEIVPPAPPGWKNASGFVLRDGRLYHWAQSAVTLRAPVTHDELAALVPGLGDVSVVRFSGKTEELDPVTESRRNYAPPPWFFLDPLINGISITPLSLWDSPHNFSSAFLVVRTRPSALLGIVFGQRFDFGQNAVIAFAAVAVLFLLFEIGSLIVGISLTRTITGAVHNLYVGTQRVSHGDFSHRIAVRGNDQLADLGTSFNQMTANLERLIVVEKEKERLQSEIEIAREVQTQLFPKQPPVLRTAQVRGVCHPARMVSGDYYDFLALPDSILALAIGDVAGKGISAALLMAAIQSTMRTQLSAAIPMAAAAGTGRHNCHFSTATLVAELNRQLYANTSPEKFATFCFGLYDETSSVLKYTNAGHVPPILLRDGAPIAELEVTGTVVGAFPFSRYEEQEIELRPGDLLVAYTDGVIEPENPYGEDFGEKRLKDLLVKYCDQPSTEIIARVMESVEQWTASSELQDDMTMLLVRRL
jgi:phosphoserine phosphatase RsbU/P